jgi:hypothetical protein
MSALKASMGAEGAAAAVPVPGAVDDVFRLRVSK